MDTVALFQFKKNSSHKCLRGLTDLMKYRQISLFKINKKLLLSHYRKISHKQGSAGSKHHKKVCKEL